MGAHQRLSTADDNDEAELFLPLPPHQAVHTRAWVTRVSLFSPAQSDISYAMELLHQSTITSPTKYQLYGPEVDAAWHELYSVGHVMLYPQEVKQLSNQTQPIMVNGEEVYSTTLAVFHNLHCLNLLRMSLYPDFYKSPATEKQLCVSHLAHCIDIMRETVMCAADVTPMPGRYSSDNDGPEVLFLTSTEHWCQDFGRIKDWALERQPTEDLLKVYDRRN
ncbi:hypothetical protein C8J57DRAFT_1393854, partial [Mycena rebaudengoi]